jgi:lysozyme
MPPDTLYHTKRLLTQAYQSVAERADVPMVVEGYRQGVDISKWQGNVNFVKLKSKVSFCYIRAGYGNDYIDPRLNEYRRGCHANNLAFGLYWFVTPGKDWRKHALNFYTIWHEDPGALPPVFDLEQSGGLNKTKLESWLKKMYDSFCGLSGKEYQDLMTYTSPGWCNKSLPLTNWLKLTQLWVAHWTTRPQPIIPNEWAIPGKTWTYWQYSSTGKGSDYGVQSSKVDLDRGR